MAADVLVRAPDPLRVTEQMRDAAQAAPGRWLFAVDRGFDPAGEVPPEALVGAWRIDDAGEVTSEFRANPAYRPSPRALGWPEPADELDRTAQLAAAGYATLDDVAVALLFCEVAYAVAANAALLLDEDGRIAVHSAGVTLPPLPDGAIWRRSTGRALAVAISERAGVLVNPGRRWEALVPGVELLARAGGEASGYLLAERIDEFLDGELDGLALHDAFRTAQVFCQAGERPGFVAVDEPDGRRSVPVFTTLVELARFAGQTPWFAALGQDVLNLLPDGCDVVVDPGSQRALRLRGDATQRLEPEVVGGG